MDDCDEEKLLFNVKLAKYIGLFHILDRKNGTYHGINVHKIIVNFLTFYVVLMTLILGINGVYFWTDNTTTALIYLATSVNSIFPWLNILLLVYNSEEVLNCLKIVRFDFISYKHSKKCLLEFWRNRSLWVTNTFVFSCLIALIFYPLCPLLLTNTLKTLHFQDGSIGNFRLNVFNMYFLISDETYNKYYNVFHIIETVLLVILSMSIQIFDTVLITICYAFSCQLQIINEALKSLGHPSTYIYKINNIYRL